MVLNMNNIRGCRERRYGARFHRIRVEALLWMLCYVGFVSAQGKDNPLLVILADSGQTRDGLAVLNPHPDAKTIVGVLSRGFPLKILRLYRDVQVYLNPGGSARPEPAYLLFSSHQGGFPRFGFYFNDEIKPGIGYVDLFKTKTLVGRFSAVDQIFPHELGHIIVRLLSGEPTPGGSNQMHAIGVRTDQKVAFQEGFAEHLQIMAIDDPDADPATRTLTTEEAERRLAERELDLYLRELKARWSFATPRKMGFLFWYSSAEQVLRYRAVKDDTFARASDTPDVLLNRGNLYDAYLYQNIFPGAANSRPKPAAVMLSTEGVVSNLFYRWVNDAELAEHYVDESFYMRFGTVRSTVSPVENAYLKLFHAIHIRRSQDTASVIEAYKSAFPEESHIVDRIVSAALLGQRLPAAKPIWLANPYFRTGTGLFDQFRGAPRVNTFDLNAATAVDLIGVPGIDRSLAEAILKAGPYSTLDELESVPGMTRGIVDRFKSMAKEMGKVMDEGGETAMSSLPRIVMSYLWRALLVVAASAVSGGLLYRRIRNAGLFRSLTNGLAISFLVAAFSWAVIGAEGILGDLLPVLVLGLPSMLFQMARKRWARALPEFFAWAAAAIPAKILTYPWF